MSFRLLALTGLSLALAGCSTTTTTPTTTPEKAPVVKQSNAVDARWKGQSAGQFFAQFGPQAKEEEGSNGETLYTWRGGYAKATIAPAPTSANVKGKPKQAARTQRLVCQVQLTVDDSYTIRSIRIQADTRATDGGPSRCAEYLTSV